METAREREQGSHHEQGGSREPREAPAQERAAALKALLGDVGHLALSLAKTYEQRTQPARREQLHFV